MLWRSISTYLSIYLSVLWLHLSCGCSNISLTHVCLSLQSFININNVDTSSIKIVSTMAPFSPRSWRHSSGRRLKRCYCWRQCQDGTPVLLAIITALAAERKPKTIAIAKWAWSRVSKKPFCWSDAIISNSSITIANAIPIEINFSTTQAYGQWTMRKREEHAGDADSTRGRTWRRQWSW